MSIGTAFSYTRASIETVRWMSRTPKTSYGKSIRTMTTAATASATSYTGIISMHMGRSSRTTGPTLIRFAWYTGRLAIGVFDDATPGGPIEVLEVNGEPI